MKTLTNDELKTVLENHIHWVNEDCEDWIDMRADLSGANLRYANLRYANLRYADLRYADLSNADLWNADLSGANLWNANLSNANLRYADLSNADLWNAKGIAMTCPSDGAFTAWKKLFNGAIAKLLIPEDAKRSSATGRKCRSNKAVVLAIYDKNGESIERGRSAYSTQFVYKVGETVTPDSFDDNRWNECSNGIHFFITRTEAEEYEG